MLKTLDKNKPINQFFRMITNRLTRSLGVRELLSHRLTSHHPKYFHPMPGPMLDFIRTRLLAVLGFLLRLSPACSLVREQSHLHLGPAHGYRQLCVPPNGWWRRNAPTLERIFQKHQQHLPRERHGWNQSPHESRKLHVWRSQIHPETEGASRRMRVHAHQGSTVFEEVGLRSCP